MRGSNALEQCDILLVVGTPMLRPADVARLARAYYHDDPQLIDETSVRGADGRWRYRDPRLQRVADALTRAELTQCAHRNRPLRYDGRVVVTLCAEEILYLPVTSEIASLPQLTPEGVPLALARRAAAETRMAKAAQALEERGEAVTSRALAAAAHISLNTACTRLRQRETGTTESEAALSVVHYSSSSVSDNMPADEKSAESEPSEDTPASVDPPVAAPRPTPSDVEPRLQPLPAACPAASHQLLWHWRAGSLQCPACGG